MWERSTFWDDGSVTGLGRPSIQGTKDNLPEEKTPLEKIITSPTMGAITFGAEQTIKANEKNIKTASKYKISKSKIQLSGINKNIYISTKVADKALVKVVKPVLKVFGAAAVVVDVYKHTKNAYMSYKKDDPKGAIKNVTKAGLSIAGAVAAGITYGAVGGPIGVAAGIAVGVIVSVFNDWW